MIYLKISTKLRIYIYLRYEYHWKDAEKSFPIILTSLKSNKLLLDQGRLSGNFVSNFQPSYIKNYLT